MSNLLGVSIKPGGKKLRVLDFDSECRPMAWYGGDFVTKQPTAIAWKFVGDRGAPTVAAIGESFDSRLILDEEAAMLKAFVDAYDQADVVTGHYIRGFDLPMINGALIRLGLPGLADKLSQDTKLDFARAGGLSKSQENLGAMFELNHPKFPMNTGLWMRANLLLPDGIALTKKRCTSDVSQHIELRERMLSMNLLRSPVVWTAGASGQGGGYTP